MLVHWCTILDNIKSINLRLNSPTLIESFENSFLKNGPNPLFSFYSHDKYRTNTINEKNIDGVLGTQTLGGGMVGTDESTELWRHPWKLIFTVASSRSSRQKVKFEFAENSTHKKLLSLSLSPVSLLSILELISIRVKKIRFFYPFVTIFYRRQFLVTFYYLIGSIYSFAFVLV